MKRRTVLLTGATGYIASHTWLALQAAGWGVVGLDDFSNSSPEVLKRLERLSGAVPVFAIGGADGHSDAMRSRAIRLLSFGRMTIAHRLVRIVVLEQLYRAFKILSGEPYHRD